MKKQFLIYNVKIIINNLDLKNELILWLKPHAEKIVSLKALSYKMNIYEDYILMQYYFTDHNSFLEYEKKYAPSLRQDGLERFPQGLVFERYFSSVE